MCYITISTLSIVNCTVSITVATATPSTPLTPILVSLGISTINWLKLLHIWWVAQLSKPRRI